MVRGLVRKAESDPAKARQLVGVARLSHAEMTSGLLQAKACVVRRTLVLVLPFHPVNYCATSGHSQHLSKHT
jgi:hypothetical protein